MESLTITRVSGGEPKPSRRTRKLRQTYVLSHLDDLTCHASPEVTLWNTDGGVIVVGALLTDRDRDTRHGRGFPNEQTKTSRLFCRRQPPGREGSHFPPNTSSKLCFFSAKYLRPLSLLSSPASPRLSSPLPLLYPSLLLPPSLKPTTRTTVRTHSPVAARAPRLSHAGSCIYPHTHSSSAVFSATVAVFPIVLIHS